MTEALTYILTWWGGGAGIIIVLTIAFKGFEKLLGTFKEVVILRKEVASFKLTQFTVARE